MNSLPSPFVDLLVFYLLHVLRTWLILLNLVMIDIFLLLKGPASYFCIFFFLNYLFNLQSVVNAFGKISEFLKTYLSGELSSVFNFKMSDELKFLMV